MPRNDTQELIDKIEDVTNDADFGAVMTALETVMARRLLRVPPPGRQVPVESTAAMIADHMRLLLVSPDLLN
jgi:hypothetical protein